MSNAAIVIEHEPEPQPRKQLAAVATTPADLLSMALSQGADLDRLERLMALQTQWEEKEARKAFVEAMTAFKAEPIEILKNKRVSFTTQKGTTSYNHAELSDVVDAAITGMAKHGLSHSWDLNQSENGWIEVTCVVTHSQGHSKSVSLKSQKEDSGTKNHIQAVASAITYLERYTLLAALGLATKGHDDDGRGASSAPHRSREETPEHGSNPERDKLVADLYACADNGMDALIKAWKEMSESGRQLVGIEFGQIKKRAEGRA
jgi:hypothetical protein